MDYDLEKEVEKALHYLADTDVEHARLRALQARYQEIRKTILAMGFDSATGAAEARRQKAHSTPEYFEHIDRQQETDEEFWTMDNKRRRAIVVIDLFRTVSANIRKG